MWIQFLLLGFVRHIQDVAHEMGLAPVPGHPVEVAANRVYQSAMIVVDDYVDTAQFPSIQPGEKFSPTGFGFAVAQH